MKDANGRSLAGEMTRTPIKDPAQGWPQVQPGALPPNVKAGFHPRIAARINPIPSNPIPRMASSHNPVATANERMAAIQNYLNPPSQFLPPLPYKATQIAPRSMNGSVPSNIGSNLRALPPGFLPKANPFIKG